MSRKKERLLATVKKHTENGGKKTCLCKHILEHKIYRLRIRHNKLDADIKQKKQESAPYQNLLATAQKVGNKLRALKELLHEIEQAEKQFDNMFEVEIDGVKFYRLSEESHRRRSCGEKVQYESKDDAALALADISAKSNEDFTAYLCGYCQQWHIGHSVKSEKPKIGGGGIRAYRRQLFINNARCWYCGEVVDGDNSTLDHQIPKSWGGKNTAENLVLACKMCNSAKGNNSVEHYRTKLEMLCRNTVVFFGERQENLEYAEETGEHEK